MIRICLLLFFIFLFSGCKSIEKDPKVQGALQIAKIEEDGRKRVLIESNKLLKNNTDFIIDTSVTRICLYEREESRIEKKELSGKIGKIFKGTFDGNTDLYASKIPVHTSVFEERNNNNNTIYLFAEVSRKKDRIYQCHYYTGVNDQ